MHLLTRLARLEQKAPRPPAPPCTGCGGNADGTYSGNGRVRCEFEGDTPSRDNDFCQVCGRQLVFHIEFDKGG